MRIVFLLLCSLFYFQNCLAVAINQQPHSTIRTSEHQENMTPQTAFEDLVGGNQRFAEGKMKNRDLIAQANKSVGGQFPDAVILNCMDSRTPTELTFDQGIGDVLAIRIAGNIQNNDILGSMEFGTQVMGAKLIAVIGHTHCGAMRGACEKVKLGNLTSLLQKIAPAVREAMKQTEIKDCSDYALVDEIAKYNVIHTIKEIQQRSPIIRKLIAEKKIGIVGGIQDISTGRVTFFEEGRIIPESPMEKVLH